MLMPIIAALGSFVISERILKPKATALFVLACLAVYDIFVSPPKPILYDAADGNTNTTTATTHNITELDEFWDYDAHNDVAEEDDLATSLRCYRGPALLAFALFCAAYSLRVWRRNGVACDELIFLPGTPHEFRCIGGKQNNSTHGVKNIATNDEGRAEFSDNSRGEEGHEHEMESMSPIKNSFSEGDAAAGSAKSPLRGNRLVLVSQSHDGLELVNLDASSSAEAPDVERMPLILDRAVSNSAPNSPSSSRMKFIRDQALKGIDMLVIRKPLRPPTPSTDCEIASGKSSSGPNLANSEVYDAEYAPSAPSVLGAALDLSLPVLFNFHMFVVLMKDHYKKEALSEEEEGLSDEGAGVGKVTVKDYTWMTPPQVPPKVLPLFFITPLIIRSMVPPRQRRRFYKTVLQGTFFFYFKPVRFRDAFVADCVTSLVRPIGDLVYALAYYFIVIFGLISGKHTLNEAGYILSDSKLMHGLVLPALSILPLFIKFLQTLRQAYDTGKRWPYLGNSFKYLTAGLVILYGMTHAAAERSPWFKWAFVFATIYQIVWDTCIDWELLVIAPRASRRDRTSSPIAKLCRLVRDVWEQIRLRPKRLFDDDSFYWKALFINAGLRFCWMAGFIPAYRVSILDGSTQVTFVDKAHGWSFVLMATLEIFRRSIWGIVKVELETIKLTSESENDIAMASTADEYIREGKWNVPRDAIKPKESNSRNWRCRSTKSGKSTLEEADTKVAWLDSNQSQYSILERTKSAPSSLETLETSSEEQTQTHRWFCMTVSSGFIRWLFILELLLWPCVFLVLSYHVILAE